MDTVSFSKSTAEQLERKIRKAASIATMLENELESEPNEVAADAAGVIRKLLRSVLDEFGKFNTED